MGVASYFRNIWRGVVTTINGLRVTGRHLFSKPYTVQYPEQQPYFSPHERGLHEFEPEKCIICELCAKACPVDCIYIEQEGRGKSATLTRYAIDYSKCLFCSLCVDPCPVDCIHMGQQHDLTSFERQHGTIIEFTRGEGPWRTARTSADPRTGVGDGRHQPAVPAGDRRVSRGGPPSPGDASTPSEGPRR